MAKYPKTGRAPGWVLGAGNKSTLWEDFVLSLSLSWSGTGGILRRARGSRMSQVGGVWSFSKQKPYFQARFLCKKWGNPTEIFFVDSLLLPLFNKNSIIAFSPLFPNLPTTTAPPGRRKTNMYELDGAM